MWIVIGWLLFGILNLCIDYFMSKRTTPGEAFGLFILGPAVLIGVVILLTAACVVEVCSSNKDIWGRDK